MGVRTRTGGDDKISHKITENWFLTQADKVLVIILQS